MVRVNTGVDRPRAPQLVPLRIGAENVVEVDEREEMLAERAITSILLDRPLHARALAFTTWSTQPRSWSASISTSTGYLTECMGTPHAWLDTPRHIDQLKMG